MTPKLTIHFQWRQNLQKLPATAVQFAVWVKIRANEQFQFEMDQYFPTKATDRLYLELFVDFLFAIVPPRVLNLGGNLIGLLPERGVNIGLTPTAFSDALDMPRCFSRDPDDEFREPGKTQNYTVKIFRNSARIV